MIQWVEIESHRSIAFMVESINLPPCSTTEENDTKWWWLQDQLCTSLADADNDRDFAKVPWLVFALCAGDAELSRWYILAALLQHQEPLAWARQIMNFRNEFADLRYPKIHWISKLHDDSSPLQLVLTKLRMPSNTATRILIRLSSRFWNDLGIRLLPTNAECPIFQRYLSWWRSSLAAPAMNWAIQADHRQDEERWMDRHGHHQPMLLIRFWPLNLI